MFRHQYRERAKDKELFGEFRFKPKNMEQSVYDAINQSGIVTSFESQDENLFTK